MGCEGLVNRSQLDFEPPMQEIQSDKLTETASDSLDLLPEKEAHSENSQSKSLSERNRHPPLNNSKSY